MVHKLINYFIHFAPLAQTSQPPPYDASNRQLQVLHVVDTINKLFAFVTIYMDGIDNVTEQFMNESVIIIIIIITLYLYIYYIVDIHKIHYKITV